MKNQINQDFFGINNIDLCNRGLLDMVQKYRQAENFLLAGDDMRAYFAIKIGIALCMTKQQDKNISEEDINFCEDFLTKSDRILIRSRGLFLKWNKEEATCANNSKKINNIL